MVQPAHATANCNLKLTAYDKCHILIRHIVKLNESAYSSKHLQVKNEFKCMSTQQITIQTFNFYQKIFARQLIFGYRLDTNDVYVV